MSNLYRFGFCRKAEKNEKNIAKKQNVAKKQNIVKKQNVVKNLANSKENPKNFVKPANDADEIFKFIFNSSYTFSKSISERILILIY